MLAVSRMDWVLSAFWPGRMGAMARICLSISLGSLELLCGGLAKLKKCFDVVGQNSHFSIDDPVQVLLVWLVSRTSTTKAGLAEKVRLEWLFSALCSFLSLSVFDEGLLVGSDSLIGFLDGVGNLVPEPLRLTLSLFLEWT